MSMPDRPYGLLAYGLGPYNRWRFLELEAAPAGRSGFWGTAEYAFNPEVLEAACVGRSSVSGAFRMLWETDPACDADWVLLPPCDTDWAPVPPCDTDWALTDGACPADWLLAPLPGSIAWVGVVIPLGVWSAAPPRDAAWAGVEPPDTLWTARSAGIPVWSVQPPPPLMEVTHG